MPLKFDWDVTKARANVRDHRVSFEEASTVFGDPFALISHDEQHSGEEDRELILGLSSKGRVLLVVFTETSGTIRIISSWRANKRERDGYQANRKE